MTSNTGGWQQLVRTTGTGRRETWLSGMIVCKPQDSLSYSAGSEPPWMKEKQASIGHPHSPLGQQEIQDIWSRKNVEELGLLPVQLFRKVYKEQMQLSPHLL